MTLDPSVSTHDIPEDIRSVAIRIAISQQQIVRIVKRPNHFAWDYHYATDGRVRELPLRGSHGTLAALVYPL